MTLPPNDLFSQPAPQGRWGRSSAPAPDPGPVSGAEPGSDLGADLGAALSFAGKALLRNPVAYLVSGLVCCVLLLLILGGGLVGGFVALISLMESSPYPESSGGLALLVFYGVVLTALLHGLVVFVGTLLLYVPGLIAAVMFLDAIPATLRGASPVEAMKESLALARANLGTTIVAYLVLRVIASLASTFVIPVLVLTPFLMLFELGMYERLSGRRLPEPAQG